MANFDIVEAEGERWVKISTVDEAVRIEAGALLRMQGKITITTPIPTIGRMIACALSDEPIIRPKCEGTGEIHLESSSGGYHTFTVAGESWILENGAYWTSENSVTLGLFRERALTSYWAGEGFIDYQTKVSGHGKVVLNTSGPVEEIDLKGDQIAVEGKLVIARTEGVEYRVRRPTRSRIGYYLSGENLVRTYSGEGKVLLTTSQYWHRRLLNAVRIRS